MRFSKPSCRRPASASWRTAPPSAWRWPPRSTASVPPRAKTKIIILLTDGINNRGEIDPRDAARMAKDYNIKVYTIGVGTRGEAPYPVVDQLGQQQYVMVQVEIDEALLRISPRRPAGSTSAPPTRTRCRAFSPRSTAGKNRDRLQELLRDDGTLLLFRRRRIFPPPAGRSRPQNLSSHPALKSFPVYRVQARRRGTACRTPIYLTKNRTSSWAERMRRKVTSG